MLGQLFLHLFRINISKLLYHKFSYFFEMISIVLSLFVYFYTSKAFVLGSNVFGYQGLTYFDFIIIGDLALMLPLYIIEAPIRNIKDSIDTKVINTFIILKIAPWKIFLTLGYSDFLRTLMRVLINIILIVIFFDTGLGIEHIKNACLQIVLVLPFCLCLGALVSAFYIYFGRGVHASGYITVLISIFSGAFFPVEVLPRQVYVIFEGLIPLVKMLKGVRSLGHYSENIWIFILWMMMLVPIGMIVQRAFFKYSNRGLRVFRF